MLAKRIGMSLNDTFQRRFDELAAQYKQMPWKTYDEDFGQSAPSGAWHKWATSALNIIRAVFGENSPHYEHFVSGIAKCNGFDYQVDRLHGVFLSAKEDFEGGYVFNIDLQVSGEVFGDFVVMAKEALAENHVDVAAVLACAALEDALKRFAAVNALQVSEKNMTEVINALKSKGLVSGAQKSLLAVMPKIRDYALHADWEKITAPDISSVIGFVEQFLLSHFTAG